MFYFETFRIILNPSSVKKLKQLLAMSAIQNHNALWRKKRQCCDAKDVKGKPRPPATSKKAPVGKCHLNIIYQQRLLLCLEAQLLSTKEVSTFWSVSTFCISGSLCSMERTEMATKRKLVEIWLETLNICFGPKLKNALREAIAHFTLCSHINRTCGLVVRTLASCLVGRCSCGSNLRRVVPRP